MKRPRQLTGTVAYHSGRVAEDCVAHMYERSGHEILARRWRGSGGEVDLIVRDGKVFVFVEVKKSTSHAEAAQRLSQRQIARISEAATEFVAGTLQGLAAEMRFDVALVDGLGQIKILENALAT